MLTAKLSDREINYWAARAQGWHQEVQKVSGRTVWIDERDRYQCEVDKYTPVSNWAQGGELLDRFSVFLSWSLHQDRGTHFAYIRQRAENGQYGFSALEAICRAVIQFGFGDEVPDQDPEFST